jgi:putative SOS response-associated peptidase YedK
MVMDMCGRYTLFTDRELQDIDDIINQLANDPNFGRMKTGEIFPTEVAPVLTSGNGRAVPHLFTWGFPSFHTKKVIINARAETANEKPMFRASLARRRCVIPSTGFYEWDCRKKKFLYNMPDSPLLYMAGIYNQFEGENRFVILTTDSNPSVSDVHERMPLVLTENQVQEWLFEDRLVNEIIEGEHPLLVKKAV